MHKVSNPWRVATLAIVFSALAGLAGAQNASEDNSAVVNPFAGRDDVVAEGKTLFNIHCSHCHGPNAFQGERKRDLRRLSKKYGDKMTAMFYTTATNGRPQKGMPTWKGVLDDEVLWKIFTFLQTVQNK
jgi:mono/diheme cytochrome c family protein